MKTLERYVFKSFLTSFLVAFLVLTFVLTIGITFQIVGFIADGAPIGLVCQFAAVNFPEAAQLSAPVAFLVSSYLVFSRLSTDSEIAAMRACGVNIWQVMRWPIVFAGIFSLVAAYLNNEVVPPGHEISKTLKTQVSNVGNLVDIVKPGEDYTQIPNAKLFVSGKEGRTLTGVRFVDERKPGSPVTLLADRASIVENGTNTMLQLENVYSTSNDFAGNGRDLRGDGAANGARPGAFMAKRFLWPVPELNARRVVKRKDKDLTFMELVGKIGEGKERIREARYGSAADAAYGQEAGDVRKSAHARVKARRQELSRTKVELSQRFVIALASICFTLVGIPLGIRAQRKETTIGMLYALLSALGYFGWWFWWSTGMAKSYHLHPEFVIWLPVPVFVAVAVKLARKNQ